MVLESFELVPLAEDPPNVAPELCIEASSLLASMLDLPLNSVITTTVPLSPTVGTAFDALSLIHI